MLAIGLVIIGILSRCIVHAPNFTPLLAITLFAGAFLPKRQAIIVPISLFVITDLIIGLHSVVAFTWGSVGLIALMGLYLKRKKSIKNVALTSFFSAIVFYVVTNFGVWAIMSTYPKTLAGLIDCYVMAIPYFRNTLVSTVLYSLVMFAGYEYLANRIKKTRFAFVVS